MLDRTGPIYFEFTEVEGRGTVVEYAPDTPASEAMWEELTSILG